MYVVVLTTTSMFVRHQDWGPDSWPEEKVCVQFCLGTELLDLIDLHT